MHWKFWKKPPSLSLRKNIRRSRPVVVCHEIISGTIAAISAIMSTVVGVGVGGMVYGLTVGAIVKGLIIAGAAFYSFSQAQKAKKTGQTRDFRASGHLLNTKSTSEPLPPKYGTKRTGGNIVYMNCTGADNKYLHMVITFSEGPVSGINTDVSGDIIWLDDKRIQNFGSLASWEFFTGTSTQTVCATLQAADANWDDAMRYTAYLYLCLEYSEEKFASMPNVTLELKGMLIYDTRDTLTKFSANNALVAYDFLRNDRYSIGLASALFDTSLITDAANWCDTNDYEFNGEITERQSVMDNLDDVLKNFRAGLIWSEGEYKLIVYEYDTPVMSLTEDDIDADSFQIIVPGIPETPNRVIIGYIDAVDNYVSKTRVIEDNDAVLVYDLQERDFELDLKGTTDATQATKLGSYYIERNRLNYQFSISCHPRAYALDPMDMIQITHSLPGWTAKVLRVLDVEQPQDGRVKLLCLDEVSTLYDDIVNVAVHNAYETNLPDPMAPPPNVTGLALAEATDKPGIVITFTRPGAWTNWKNAKIFISDDGSVYKSLAVVWTGDPYVCHDVIPGETYWIKIVSYSFFDVPSTTPPVEDIELLTEGLRPPILRGLELFGQGNDTEWKNKDVKFAWRPIMLKSGAGVKTTADSELLNAGQGFPDAAWQDYKIEIWVGGVRKREEYVKNPVYIYSYEKNLEDNGTASSSITIKVWNRSIYNILSLLPAELAVTNPVPSLPGITATSIMNGVRFSLSPSTVKDHEYWKIRTKVATGAWSTWQDIDELIYERILTVAEITAYGLLPTIYAELKDIDTFGNESSVATTNTTAFAIAGLALEDLAITVTKIADNAIETPKIKALAITADKIAANAVIAAKIGAGEVVAGKIAANAITAAGGEIANLAVVEAKIAALAVTEGKIGALAVTDAKIAAAAIKTAKIDDLQVTTLKISNNAVTNRGEARVSDYLLGSGDWTDVITLSITTTGGSVWVSARIYLSNVSVGVQYQLLRDSTVLDGPFTINIAGGVIFLDLDSPAAGTYTYKIQGKTTGGGSSQIYYLCIIATEYLK